MIQINKEDLDFIDKLLVEYGENYYQYVFRGRHPLSDCLMKTEHAHAQLIRKINEMTRDAYIQGQCKGWDDHEKND